MHDTAFEIADAPENMRSLQQLIGRLANECGVNLGERQAVRRLLDLSGPQSAPAVAGELRTLLILRYRLEAACSEDLGYEGMNGLWRQLDDTLRRHRESRLS